VKYFNDYENLKILSELGLDEKEALIYLSALEIGGGTITELAEHCHIERTGIYYHLEKLLSSKLIKAVVRGKRTYYLPSDPNRLKKIFDQKQANFDALFPKMEERFAKKTSKSIVQYYEGAEEVDHFYDRVYTMLKDLKPEENLVYGLGSSFHEVLRSNAKFAEFEKPAEQINIKLKAILPKSQKSKNPKELEDHPYIVTRYNLPPAEIKYISDKYRYPGSMMVTENHVIMYDWRNLIFSITENKNSAETWRMFFELIWDSVK
jgi:sugar-specific transcriptional regulator TrmB